MEKINKRAKALKFFTGLIGLVFFIGIPYVFIVSRGLFEAYIEGRGNAFEGLGIIALLIVYWIPFSILSLINGIYSFALSNAFKKVADGKKQTIRLGATIPYLVITLLCVVLGVISAFFCYGIDKGLAIIVALELIIALITLSFSIKFRAKKGETSPNNEPVNRFDDLSGGSESGGSFDEVGSNLGGFSIDNSGFDNYSLETSVEETETILTETEEEDEETKLAKDEGKKILNKLYIYEITPDNVDNFIDEVSVVFTDLMFTKKNSKEFKIYDKLVSIIMNHEKDLDYLNKFFF